MIEWLNSMDVMTRIFWAIALASSLIFVIQSVLTFVGADADASGMDMDAGASVDDPSDMGTGMGLLTFRNFVNFFVGFGWMALIMKEKTSSLSLVIIVSAIVGALLVVAVMMLFKWLGSMQETGNIDVYKTAVDCRGTVYLTVPAERRGEGKVQIVINNSVREYNAQTDGPELKTGASIRVVDIVNPNVLLVEEERSVII